jgi:glycosyltransferase involved in cell wall biosynthesis
MISVTIPIYNEEQTIPQLVEKITSVCSRIGRPWEMILVNDGSQDGSAALLDKLAAENSHIKVVHFRRNFGQTAAMMAGFDFASGDVIIPMDGDLQNDPEDLPKLLGRIEEGYDVCSGWRKDRKDNALKRNLPSIMANKLISTLSGVELHDFGCSLKAYRAEVIKGVRLYGEMHRFLPIYAKWHGAKICEEPVNHFARTAGKSKYGLERVFKVILDLITVKFLDKYALKPMYLFGFCGILALGAALLAALWAIYLYFFHGYFFTGTPLPMIAVFSFMTGILCFLMGLLAEMITRTFYESQGKTIYLVKETRNLAARNLVDSSGTCVE